MTAIGAASAFALALSLAACGKAEVVESQVPTAVPETTTEACTHFGYCFALSLQGKMEFGLSNFCPGTQLVSYRDYLTTFRYEGETQRRTRIDRVAIEVGACT